MSNETACLVCALTDQHVPNLLSVKRFRPRHLILVASGRMLGKAPLFLQSLKAAGLDYQGGQAPLRHSIIGLRNENLIQAIHQDMEAGLCGVEIGDGMVVNLSGGTKLIGIGLYTFFEDKGTRIIYTPANAPDTFIDMSDASGNAEKFIQPGETLLGLDEFLLGYGFADKESPSNLERKRARALANYEEACGIARIAESDDLLDINDDGRKQLRNGKCAPAQVQLSGFGERVKQKGLLDRWMSKNVLDKYDGDFLTGGWAEHFLFGLLHKHAQNLGLAGLRTGSKIAPQVAKDNDNELDAACIRGTALWIFECKSGSQMNDTGVDALYKLEAVCRQVRALHAKPVFLTTGINIYQKGSPSAGTGPVLKPGIEQRIQAFGVNLVDLPKIRKLAEEDGNPDVAKEILFGGR